MEKRNYESILKLLVQNKTNNLLIGNPLKTSKILKRLYWDVSSNPNLTQGFLLFYTRAEKIKTPSDFYRPLIELRGGEEKILELEKIADASLEEIYSKWEIISVINFCGKAEDGKTENERKTPIIFIENIENFLYEMDFKGVPLKSPQAPKPKKDSNLVFIGPLQKIVHEIISINPEDIPRHYTLKDFGNLGRFGNCLNQLLSDSKAIFCGTVGNRDSPQYIRTLDNPYYRFNVGNFLVSEIY